ncbi:MAG: hypothetical protein B7733_02535 [Myxococcales bacterium FL481]|nr:MAG: hypothetical protein B7733_02535 [Myxococcales bacterium FL481]
MTFSCGAGIVDESYRGEPMLRIRGNVSIDDSFVDIERIEREALRIALFWAKRSGDVEDDRFVLEDQVVTEGTFPASFQMRIFTPPPAAALGPVVDGEGTGQGQIAVGVVLIYVDANRNRRWDREWETLVGGSVDGRMITYSPSGAASQALEWSVPAGFSVMRVIGSWCRDEEEDEEDALPDEAHGLFPIETEDGDFDLAVQGWVPLGEDIDCDGNLLEWESCDTPQAEWCAEEVEAEDAEYWEICPEIAWCFEDEDCPEDDIEDCEHEAELHDEAPWDVCPELEHCWTRSPS